MSCGGCPPTGYERLGELGLLEPLGGSARPGCDAFDSPGYRLGADVRRQLAAAADLR